MGKVLRIGTRESQLAVWQATQVQQLLLKNNFSSVLVFIKSEGDIDVQTPLYDMGVQGIFTKSLDIALLNNTIDIAVHSMKDVPTQLAKGIVQAAVLERGSHKDLLVYKHTALMNSKWHMVNEDPLEFEKIFAGNDNASLNQKLPFTIATSSLRRKAQWLNRFPNHIIENLRGNVNTRLLKVAESHWDGAIFAAAGLERINLRPVNSVTLNWMLPAPAQGAIMIVCRDGDDFCMGACNHFNHSDTATCTKIEKDFLRHLSGGCSSPIGALATIKNNTLAFNGNILSVDGKQKVTVEKTVSINEVKDLGKIAAEYLLQNGGQKIANGISHGAK